MPPGNANLSVTLSTEGPGWFPLREASRILNVHRATLRQWADNGALRVFRTAGDHRRFYREDILAFLSLTPTAASANEVRQLQEEALLKRIQRHCQQNNTAREPWCHSIDEDIRQRMRIHGRRLLSLLVQASHKKKHCRQLLAEALAAGRKYGLKMSDRELTLRDTIEAYQEPVYNSQISYGNLNLEAAPPVWT